jgi:hypothetical protein
MTAEHDSLDRIIDEAARQLTTGKPSAPLAAKVLSRIEQSEVESGFRASGWWQLVRSPWQIAAAGAVALALVLLLFASYQTGERSISGDGSDRPRTDTAMRNRQTISPPNLKETADSVLLETTASAGVTPTARLQRELEPFPTVPPIEIRSINLTPIETPRIEIARLEISPIRLDPVEAVRQETP